jgi:hypothetical protein
MNRKIDLSQIGPKSAPLIRIAAGAKTYNQLIQFAEDSGAELGVRPATRLSRALRYFGEIYNETIDNDREAKKQYEKKTVDDFNNYRVLADKKKLKLPELKKMYGLSKNQTLNYRMGGSDEQTMKLFLRLYQGQTVIIKNKYDIDTRFNIPTFMGWEWNNGSSYPPFIESAIWQIKSANGKGFARFDKLPKQKQNELRSRFIAPFGGGEIQTFSEIHGTTVDYPDIDGEHILIFPDVVTPYIKPQSFLAALDKKAHCVFDVISEKVQTCIEQMPNDTNYAALPKKIVKLREQYSNGVPDSELQRVSDELSCTISIMDVFGKIIHETKPKRTRFTVSYYNTRRDHLEALTGQPRTIVTEEELLNIQLALEEQQKLCVFQQCQTGTYSLRTAGGIFSLASTYQDSFNEFEKQLDGCSLDASLPVSKFIEYGVRSTASICFHQKYSGYIDQTKSYTQFKASAFYEGFMGKCTDFRATSKINGVGYYLTTGIDWTHADTKIKDIQKKFNWWEGGGVMFSPIIKMLEHYGAVVGIRAGCWGSRVDFEFGPNMLVKDDGVARYSRWVGCASRMTEETELLMKCSKEFAAMVMGEYKCKYTGGCAIFQTPIKRFHMAHISGGVYGYQQLNLLEQIIKMDIDKICEVRVDGIKYKDHEFELNPTFIFKKERNPMGKPSATFITGSPKWNIEMEFAPDRDHCMMELWTGAGGCGKTHIQLVDSGLVNVLYVAPSHKLERVKMNEYNVRGDVLANVIGQTFGKRDDRKIAIIRKNFNVFIVDEASMISDEIRATLFELYPDVKLIFCGDVGYQLPAITGKPIDVSKFQKVTHLTENRRCKDPKLAELLQLLRKKIDGETVGLPYMEAVPIESQPYNPVTDMILVHTHETKNGIRVLGEKYRVIRNSKTFSNGDIVYENIGDGNCIAQHAFTTHSVQGETVFGKLYIHRECFRDTKLLYTAVSRAQTLDQIVIVTSIAASQSDNIRANQLEKTHADLAKKEARRERAEYLKTVKLDVEELKKRGAVILAENILEDDGIDADNEYDAKR